MSEWTRCNYCKMQDIYKKAKKDDMRVIKKHSSFMGGIDIFIIPKGIKLPKYKEPNDDLPNGCETYQKYHRAWFMEIPRHCYC